MFDSRDQLATSSGLDKSEIDRLLGRYGSLLPELLAEAESDASLLRPLAEGTGYLRAEVNYAVTHEGARHLDDVLMRRTRLSIESSDRGRCAAEEAASIMAKRLGWTQSVLTKEIARYHALIESQMAGEHEVGAAEAAMRLRESVPGLPYP